LFARCAEPDDRELGELGERLAARALARLGWRVLGRRVRTPEGEIDLVARRGRELIALEVKASRAPGPRVFRPADRFGHAARRRQERALAWVARRLGHGGPSRLVLCEVFAPAGRAPRVYFEPLDGGPADRATFHPGSPLGR
jgi:Holliday junction resolvase-like predicted endonuclease